MKCIKRLLRKVWQIRLPHFANRFYFCALLRGIIATKGFITDKISVGHRLIKMLCEEVG